MNAMIPTNGRVFNFHLKLHFPFFTMFFSTIALKMKYAFMCRKTIFCDLVFIPDYAIHIFSIKEANIPEEKAEFRLLSFYLHPKKSEENCYYSSYNRERFCKIWALLEIEVVFSFQKLHDFPLMDQFKSFGEEFNIMIEGSFWYFVSILFLARYLIMLDFSAYVLLDLSRCR